MSGKLMSAKINFLIIQCRDFNFPHAGYIDVRLIRVKHQIKIKVIHYLPKTLGREVATYYASNTEHFVFSSIIHKTVDKVYDEIVERLNYTDKFISHYGYSDGDVAGAYDSVLDYSEWLTLTLFSF